MHPLLVGDVHRASGDAVNLRGLRRLCTKYVPRASRHPNSWGSPKWWPAHELGHLLVALPHEIGHPMFGFDGDSVDDPRSIHRALLVECAAMSVSRRLLIACGRRDLADEEAEDTDWHTMTWWEEHPRAVREFKKRRGVDKIPTTLRGLEAMLRRKVAA